jgi:hypothetical protein
MYKNRTLTRSLDFVAKNRFIWLERVGGCMGCKVIQKVSAWYSCSINGISGW